MDNSAIGFLLGGSPLLVYAVNRDLLDSHPSGDDLDSLRTAAWNDPAAAALASRLNEWPGSVLKRHNDARLLIHSLAFLAETGFTIADEGLKEILGMVMENRSPEGLFQVLVNIPRQFGGTGVDGFSWMLCDAPLLLYSLVKMGVPKSQLEQGLQYLFSLGSDIGYTCASSPELKKFNGPGKRGTLCPYADLLMLRLYSLFPERHDDPCCRSALEALLDHMEKKDKRYLFGVGTDFGKLKFPYIWYDILHVSEVLSRFAAAKRDPRFLSLIEHLKSKADGDGLFKAESVWMAWKQLDSGQKKVPSRWITYAVLRILKRIEEM